MISQDVAQFFVHVGKRRHVSDGYMVVITLPPNTLRTVGLIMEVGPIVGVRRS